MLFSDFVSRSVAVVLVATLAGTATAAIQPGSAEAQADWEARASEPSVLYATNFDDVYLDGTLDSGRSGIQTQADLHDESFENGVSPDNQNVTLNNVIRISGANSCEIITPGSVGRTGGGYFAFRPDGRTDTPRSRLYVQLSVYYPKETIGYRFLHNGDSYLKMVNFGQYGAGQVVIGEVGFSGFPALLINGTGTLGGKYYSYGSSDTPWGVATTREQPAIDNGATLGPDDSKEAWLNNYGMMPRSVRMQDGDYGYDAGDPYMYSRADMPFGWPDSRAAASGAVHWQLDGWTTIEAFLEYNGPGPVSTIKIWAAPYGEPPRLLVNEVGTVDLGSDSDTWSRFELLNYATGRQPEATRPTQRTYYDEIIVSTEPVDFPGGHDPETGSVDGPVAEPGKGASQTAAPSWVKDIEPGHWAAISLNTLADVDPEDDPAVNPNYPDDAPWHGNSGQQSVISAWNGGAYAQDFGTHGGLIAFGGGHADYFGSEVYAFDLSSRKWTRLTDPYSGPFDWPYATAEYPDGSAIPPHTYDYVDWHPETNSFIVLKGNKKLGTDHTTADIPHLFNLETNTWRSGPEMSGVALNPGGYSAYDPTRDVFWLHGGSGSNALAQYDPNTKNGDGTVGTWQIYDQQLDMTDSVAEYDPINDLMLITAFRDSTRIAAVDLKDPNKQYVLLNESGDLPNKKAASGWSWSDERQSVLYYSGGADVFEFKHAKGEWDTGTWAWRGLLSDSNNIVPSDPPGTGIRSRFQVITYSDAEIAIVVNGVTDSVYAFRVPIPIRPEPPTQVNAMQ